MVERAGAGPGGARAHRDGRDQPPVELDSSYYERIGSWIPITVNEYSNYYERTGIRFP